MRERITRRKKAPEKGEPAAAAPLQPAYFDADAKAPAETREQTEISQPEHEEPRATHAPEPAAPRPSADAGDGQRRPRRRRGRGGRERSRTGSGAPALEGATASEAGASPRVAAAKVAAAPRAASSQTPKGTVVLAIGLPGSGKSSWFKRHNITPLSSDMLRALLFDDVAEQRFQDLIFSNLRSMLKARLIARRPMNYVDATNLTPHERSSWIKLGKDYGYEVHAVFFDVPVEVCLERNHRRERTLQDDVMRRMAAKLRPPTFEEGFAKITVVKVKKKEGEAATE